MKEVFVICNACGHTYTAQGLDPSLLQMFKASSDVLDCENCGQPLSRNKAFVGHWQETNGIREVVED